MATLHYLAKRLLFPLIALMSLSACAPVGGDAPQWQNMNYRVIYEEMGI